jgi:hypothetical protein
MPPHYDISTRISNLKRQGPPSKSLHVGSDPYLTVNSKVLNDEAHNTTHGSPYINTMFEIKEHMNKHGGNAWFGSNFEELFEKAAHYAHEIMTETATPDKLPAYIASLSGEGSSHEKKKQEENNGLPRNTHTLRLRSGSRSSGACG